MQAQEQQQQLEEEKKDLMRALSLAKAHAENSDREIQVLREV